MYRNLNAELARKGIKRGSLAKELKVTPSTISQKLNGKTLITLQEAKRIKNVLGVDIELETLFALQNEN
ncbi:MAG: helix-turn-helix transcriptional regulator [Flexilinea sp.]